MCQLAHARAGGTATSQVHGGMASVVTLISEARATPALGPYSAFSFPPSLLKQPCRLDECNDQFFWVEEIIFQTHYITKAIVVGLRDKF